MKKAAKRTLCTLLAILLTLGLAACGGSKTVDPKTCTYDEMVYASEGVSESHHISHSPS